MPHIIMAVQAFMKSKIFTVHDFFSGKITSNAEHIHQLLYNTELKMGVRKYDGLSL